MTDSAVTEALALTHKMKQAAQEEQWETLYEMSTSRHQHLIEAFDSQSLNKQTIETIQLLLNVDQEINTLIKANKGQLISDLKSARKSNQAYQAYQQVAGQIE